MCKVYSSYCGTSEIEHGLCACTVNNPLAKARGLSLRTGAQTMLYLSHVLDDDRDNDKRGLHTVLIMILDATSYTRIWYLECLFHFKNKQKNV